MSKLVRGARGRRNTTVSKFRSAKKEFDKQKNYFDKAYSELSRQIKTVFSLYVPLKNAVSDIDWSLKEIVGFKLVHRDRFVKVVMIHTNEDGTSKESFWKFPSWMIDSDQTKILDGLKEQLLEQGKKYATLAENEMTESV